VILAERNALASPTLSPGGEAMRTAAAVSADVLDARRGTIDAVLATRHAGTRKLRIAYELAGPAGAPVVFVAGGISAHRHVAANALDRDAGWAEGLLDAGRALDPANLRILAFDYVGADGSIDAPIDTADQADASRCCWTRSASTCWKPSSAIRTARWSACSSPRGIRSACASWSRSAARIARIPYAAAWRALQRKAVALGQLQCADEQGLSLARQFAMLSYRTPEEFGERFDAAPKSVNGHVRVAAEDYLDAAGAKFVARTPVTAWLRLSESIDLHRVDPASVRCRPPWSPSKATGWCRCPIRSRWSKGWAPERPPARAALAVRPRRLPQGNRPHRRAPGRRTAGGQPTSIPRPRRPDPIGVSV
jgi:homoserine O-acetyltransferase